MDEAWNTSAIDVRTDSPKYRTPCAGVVTTPPPGGGGCGSNRAWGSGPVCRKVFHRWWCAPAATNTRTSLVDVGSAQMSSWTRSIVLRTAVVGGRGRRDTSGRRPQYGDQTADRHG
jgi:hypothetical protein